MTTDANRQKSPADEWTLERARNVARKNREWWPQIPDEKGRVPGVGYWVSTILDDRIVELEDQVAALKRAYQRDYSH